MMVNNPQNHIHKVCLTILLVLIGFAVSAQVLIKGPSCVIPGVTYHYIISANWDSVAAMQVCITGGKLKTGDTCSPSGGKPFGSVFVIWDQGVPGSLNIKSSLGDASLSVAQTTELHGGQLISKEKIQTYVKGVINYTFHCSAASGGSCNPSYTYQWQQSTNSVNWTDISGATEQDLVFTGEISYNTFFRRVVLEKNSNTEGYSEVAQLTMGF